MTEVLAGLFQLKLPLTGSPLRWVNGYLLKADDGWVLVDCGWNMPDVLESLTAQLADLNVQLGDIRRLVITHFHPDHYGLAGTLVGLGKMRLLMHRLDWLYIENEFSDFEKAIDVLDSWLRQNGAVQEMLDEEQRRSVDSFSRYSIIRPDELLEDDDRIGVGKHEFRVIWTPGHTAGHICLHDAERRVLLSGDHVLDPITPNVSLNRAYHDNPLGDYLESLRKVGELDADLVLPAHGEPFQGVSRRVRELLQHHDEREAEVLEALAARPCTGYDVAHALPWTRRRRPLTDLALGQQRMALTETLAHLEELRVRGRIRREEREELIWWELAPSN